MKRSLIMSLLLAVIAFAAVGLVYAGGRGGTSRENDNQSDKSGTPSQTSKSQGSEEDVTITVDVAFSGESGRTVTDQNGTTYNVFGQSFFEDKVYPSSYWGVFPLYFFGDEVGISVTVNNQSVSQRAKLLLRSESYCLNTDGSNGAELMTPQEYDATIAAGESTVVDGSFTVEYTPDVDSGLDRFLVKVYRALADAGAEEHTIGGSLNLNPNNSDYEFMMILPDGFVVTRDDLEGEALPPSPGGGVEPSFPGYSGPATYLWIMPKGNGNQNSLTVDGQQYDFSNGDRYIIEGDPMTVNLYNTQFDSNSKAIGQWWLDINAANASIGIDADEDGVADILEATELLMVKEAIFCPPEFEGALWQSVGEVIP